MEIGILIYEEAEVLDFAGPYEVFSTAERLLNTSIFNPFLISQNGGLVKTRGGFEVNTKSIYEIDTLDILIVSGGVHENIVGNDVVESWVKEISEKVAYLVSVCTGVFLLASSGCVTSGKVTTHWEDQQDLSIKYPELDVISNARWVQQSKLFTSGGIAAGIDLSLHLVSLVEGESIAINTARQMEVTWQKNV
ncbi:DJ-1/PfpI family protein [Desulforhopalus sp. 52FAK]